MRPWLWPAPRRRPSAIALPWIWSSSVRDASLVRVLSLAHAGAGAQPKSVIPLLRNLVVTGEVLEEATGKSSFYVSGLAARGSIDPTPF